MPSFLSRLFGKSDAPAPAAAEPVVHKDFRIFPEPIKESGGWRIAARVEKDIGGATKTHNLSRADTFTDRDEAVQASLGKARLAIDQLGDTLFS